MFLTGLWLMITRTWYSAVRCLMRCCTAAYARSGLLRVKILPSYALRSISGMIVLSTLSNWCIYPLPLVLRSYIAESSYGGLSCAFPTRPPQPALFVVADRVRNTTPDDSSPLGARRPTLLARARPRPLAVCSVLSMFPLLVNASRRTAVALLNARSE